MIKVATFIPNPILRFGIKFHLEKHIDNVFIFEFENLNKCLGAEFQAFDLIFLDIGNIECKIRMVKEISSIFKNSKVVVYDSAASLEQGIHFIKSGGHGFLAGSSDSNNLLDCIREVLGGKVYVSPFNVDVLLKLLVRGKGNRKKDQFLTSLTERQNQIAVLLASGDSTSAISRKLGLQASTISTVKTVIYKKLNVNNVIDLGAMLG